MQYNVTQLVSYEDNEAARGLFSHYKWNVWYYVASCTIWSIAGSIQIHLINLSGRVAVELRETLYPRPHGLIS